MLIIIPTPIGNLKDITERAKLTLSTVDLLLCEDTRTTGQLLTLYGLEKKKCLSYHKHNEKEMLTTVLDLLKKGQTIGLVSDAGTPCISDPGSLLVQAAYREGIQVTALPGPSAVITALSMSGLLFSKFQFVGFLPRQQKQFETFLKEEIAHYKGVTVAYESKERIEDSLSWIQILFPEWELVLIKELTKLHEQVFRGTASQILTQLSTNSTKGEWVLLFSKPPTPTSDLDTSIEQVRTLMSECSLSLKTAVQVVATTQKVSKNQLYQSALKLLAQ